MVTAAALHEEGLHGRAAAASCEAAAGRLAHAHPMYCSMHSCNVLTRCPSSVCSPKVSALIQMRACLHLCRGDAAERAAAGAGGPSRVPPRGSGRHHGLYAGSWEGMREEGAQREEEEGGLPSLHSLGHNPGHLRAAAWVEGALEATCSRDATVNEQSQDTAGATWAAPVLASASSLWGMQAMGELLWLQPAQTVLV